MHCPICHKPVTAPPSAGQRSDFPFCSQRCKTIDLGRWLGGKYQIPVHPDDDEAADLASPPPDDPADPIARRAAAPKRPRHRPPSDRP